VRKLWPGCAATGMRIGNGAQPRCSGSNLKGASALATWKDETREEKEVRMRPRC